MGRQSRKHVERSIVVVLGVGLAGSALAGGEEHTLRSDNGVYELSYTAVNNEAMIGNYYFAPEGESLLVDRITVALGWGQADRPFEVLIYEDPDDDGDPSNAVLLSRTGGTIIADGPTHRELKIQSVEVDPVEVTDGFFVAVHLPDQPYTPPHYDGTWETAPSAYRLDYSLPTNNWRITGVPDDGPYGGITAIDVENLANNYTTVVQLNWVIRVTGTTTPSSLVMQADMNGDGLHDFFDVSMFLNLFAQDAADFNADGTTDFFDLLAFLNAWHQDPV